MTVSLCIRQGSKRNDDSVSVEEPDWSAERQVLNPAEHLWCDFNEHLWCDFNEDLEPKTHHQTPMTYSYGYSHFIHFKTVATEVEIQFLSTWIMFPSLLPQFGSALFSSKEGASQYFCPYNECTSHWCLVSFWIRHPCLRAFSEIKVSSAESSSNQIIVYLSGGCTLSHMSWLRPF